MLYKKNSTEQFIFLGLGENSAKMINLSLWFWTI